MKAFDRKFGPDLLAGLPTTPAVYLYRDGAGSVIYVGKAKNIRRRLGDYRNASRRKVHRKMRMLVREASSLEVRLQDSEQQALQVENELIRTLKPTFNVEGAYAFLYPAIGVARTTRHSLFCFTTEPQAWSLHDFRWYGTFRSRLRAKEAFDRLVDVLSLLAHRERSAALGPQPDVRGSRLVGLRQLAPDLLGAVEDWLRGASTDGLARLSLALVDKPRARREAADVQQWLRTLRDFHDTDLSRLHDALQAVGRRGHFVDQNERDALFIQARALDSNG